MASIASCSASIWWKLKCGWWSPLMGTLHTADWQILPHVQPASDGSVSVGDGHQWWVHYIQQTGRYCHRWRKCRAGSIILGARMNRRTYTMNNIITICWMMSMMLQRKTRSVFSPKWVLAHYKKVGSRFQDANTMEYVIMWCMISLAALCHESCWNSASAVPVRLKTGPDAKVKFGSPQ